MNHPAKKIYQLYLKYNQKISTDSRSKNIKDSIFFALKGDNFNGNVFAKSALKNGAKIAIVEECNGKSNSKIIHVKDTLKTLQNIAKIHRSYFSIPFIAITGTNGKTTTKELLNNLLSAKFNTCSTQANFNNHIGVPLTLLSLRKEHQIGIIELGANHIGEIKELCSIVNPTHGVITNIGEAHLEGFGNFENIIKTKNELYTYLKKNQGIVFLNNHNKLLLKLLNTYPKRITYHAVPLNKSIPKKSNIFYCEFNPFVKIIWDKIKIQTKIIGSYNINNIAAAIRIAQYFKITKKNIKARLINFELKNNRSQFIKTKNNKIILDAYNANPTSVTLAIKNFSQIKEFKNHTNRLVVLGDMLELGEKSNTYHQNIILLLEAAGLKNCVLVGKYFKKTKCLK